MSDPVRLAKQVALLFSCSRREAEQYIEGGWITVDGNVVEEPAHRVTAQQQIVLSPDAQLSDVEPVTMLLHKPAGIDTDAALQLLIPDHLCNDEHFGMRFLKKHRSGLRATLPLQTDAAGLMVYTQDWRIARKLIDDAATVELEYIVEVSGTIAPDGIAVLNAAGIKASWQNETRLRFALKFKQAEQIGALCRQVGLTVLSIKRIRVGRIPMSSLPVGQWRYLKAHERF